MRMTYAGRPQTQVARPASVVDATLCVPSGMKPSPLCGRTTTDIAAKDSIPQQEDTWWQRVRIDTRNNLLARSDTPSVFVEEKVMLVLPPEVMRNEDARRLAVEWAGSLGLAIAPTETSDLPATAPGPNGQPNNGPNPGASPDVQTLGIFSPPNNSELTGIVQILGRAISKDFESFRVEYGLGTSPSTWTPLAARATPVELGSLATWQTAGVAPGLYTIRLVVQDRVRGQLTTSITVYVNQRAPAPGQQATPTPTPGRTPVNPFQRP
jgi:hypothetical protein